MGTSTMATSNYSANTATQRPTLTRSMKQYVSSFTKTTSTPTSRRSSQTSSSGFSTLSSTSAPPTYEASQAATARWMAVWDAEEYIRAFIDEQWSNHADHITADCTITLDELRAVGRLPQAEGSRACGRLLRAPVIHEEVALSLWERLAAEARRTSEQAADNCLVEEASSVRTTSSVHSSKSSKREAAKKFLQKVTMKTGNNQPTQVTLQTCPFCSGSCLDTSTFHPPPHPQRQPQQQQWEEGFWQREELPPKYTPRSATIERDRTPSDAARKARSKNPPNTKDRIGGSSSSSGKSKSTWLRRKREQVSATFQLLFEGGVDSDAVLIWSSAGSFEARRAKMKEKGSSAWGRVLRKPRERWNFGRGALGLAALDAMVR